MKSFDHSLWERELAEYMSLHPDLETSRRPWFPHDGPDFAIGCASYVRFGRYGGFASFDGDDHDPVPVTCI